ncbi:phytanoyl-CoA dioxygenase family protein [Mycolicibacterium sarraceniae]|nr:phytanoyl-CoA dioxygenase family protein [Mycolicibacterium sarraceniae]
MTASTHVPATTSLAELADHPRRDGYVIVDNLVPGSLMDIIADESAPYLDATPMGYNAMIGRKSRRTGALVARSPGCRTLIGNPTILGVCKDFLGHAIAFQVMLTQVISIEPGESDQALHRDQNAFDFYPFPDDYHVQCNTLWAMTDYTADSVLLYSGKIVHSGAANRSQQVRRAINVNYCVGWVRQEENQFLSLPTEVARTLDDDLLKLIGYQEGAWAMGYFRDLEDPLRAIRGGNVAYGFDATKLNGHAGTAFADQLTHSE